MKVSNGKYELYRIERGIPMPDAPPSPKEVFGAMKSGESVVLPARGASQQNRWRVNALNCWGKGRYASKIIDAAHIRVWKK